MQILDLRSNLINNILPLSGLTNLQELKLNTNQVSDISPLSGITDLWRLWLQENPLNVDAYNIYIPLLESYGTMVSHDPLVWRTLTINSTDGGSVIEPGEGDFDYTNSTIVNIQAVADPGYYFVEWTGTAVNDGDMADPDLAITTVIMNKDCTLQANFDESDVIYVDDDAVGLNDGSSWQNAYTFLQDALADANSAEKPVEIRVAQGTYKPDQGTGITPNNPNATLQLINGTILKGGFAGFNEPDPNACDVVLYETVLSGDLAGNDLPFEKLDDIIIEPSIADNSYRIVTTNAVDNNTILDGFIITGAIISRYVIEVDEPEFEGAGLFISDNSNIIIRNCIFTKNATSGILCKNSNPTVINCTFEKNTKRGYGAGMCIRGSSIRIISCIFNENQSFAGGGIESSESMLWLENCAFTQNVVHGCRSHVGGLGGALCCGDPLAGSEITECSFSDNIAIGGAGIFLGTYDTTPIGRGEVIPIIGCTFTHNRASFGAAIDNYTNSIIIENSSFIDNSAITSGGVVNNTFGTTSFSNCLLTGNSAGQRASVISAHGSCWPDGTLDHFFAIEFINCTLVENIAPFGRMVTCRSEGSAELDSVQISNCIISNGGNEIYNPDGSQITIDYTNLLGGTSTIDDPCNAVVWGVSNIDVDPCFIDPGYWDPNGTPDNPNDDSWIDGDYHLKSQAGRWDPNSQSWIQDDVTSPCIDAGDPNSPISHEPFPNGGIINMGVYGGTTEASLSIQQPLPLIGQASNPNPPDEATGVFPDVILSWFPGKNAVTHDVYFGNTFPPKFVRNQTETEFDLGHLVSQQECYWRIDEINSQGNIITGDTWRFTVTEYKSRCFISETPVYINGELVPFSNVTKEQLNSGIAGQNKIEEIQEHEGTFVCYDVLLESGNCITVADNHYFMAESGHWLALHELKAGTRLKTSKGIIGIISVKKRPNPYIGKVYNLKVAGSDRYMVGKDMVIVRDY